MKHYAKYKNPPPKEIQCCPKFLDLTQEDYDRILIIDPEITISGYVICQHCLHHHGYLTGVRLYNAPGFDWINIYVLDIDEGPIDNNANPTTTAESL